MEVSGCVGWASTHDVPGSHVEEAAGLALAHAKRAAPEDEGRTVRSVRYRSEPPPPAATVPTQRGRTTVLGRARVRS